MKRFTILRYVDENDMFKGLGRECARISQII